MFTPRALLGAVLFVAACVLATVFVAPRLLPGLRPAAAPVERALPALAEAQGWLDSEPLAAADLPGAPAVLVLWSDTDPRALAALPVLEAWKRAWSRWGVRVIAVRCGGWSDVDLRGAAAIYNGPADLLARYDRSLLGLNGG